MSSEPQEPGSERSWSGGDAEVWCEDGHDPKIAQHVAGSLYECPHTDCEARYKIEVRVTPDPKDDGLRADGGVQQEDVEVPLLPWCRDCWDQAAEGTREELEGELPDECQHCGSTEVTWI